MNKKSGVGSKESRVIRKHRAALSGTGFARSCSECAGCGGTVVRKGDGRPMMRCSRTANGKPRLVTELEALHCDTTRPPELVDLAARGIYDDYYTGVCPLP